MGHAAPRDETARAKAWMREKRDLQITEWSWMHVWLVRAEVDSDKRKGCHRGPGQGPCLKVPCEILRCTHMPATVHSTMNFSDEGLNE